MKKIVINRCFGGFSLSAKALKRYCDLQNKPCYFFTLSFANGYQPIEIGNEDKLFYAFSIKNPIHYTPKEWIELPKEEKEAFNNSHIYCREIKRDDPYLIKVVEELGEESFGLCAELKIVEIPDDVDWEISEYDGMEHISEKHRTWE